MATGTEEQPKKRRSVMITDADWARILKAAGAEGLRHGDYLVQAHRFWQNAPDAAAAGIPPQVLRSMMHMLRIIEQAEKLRLDNLDGGRTWRRLEAEAELWLDGQTSFD